MNQRKRIWRKSVTTRQLDMGIYYFDTFENPCEYTWVLQTRFEIDV